ncbi:MAG: exodeoxyribonuclease V subunit alpha [Pseudomonadales bacterium]|nr:exodeoxyribonuclease V subunit alpha [Pseudomonadales bacterium]
MSLLKSLQDNGQLSPLSVSFARFLARHGQQGEDSVLCLTAACLSECNQHGDVCIDLAPLAGKPLFPATPAMPELQPWRQILLASPCVVEATGDAPLYLDGSRLYLQRFWRYEGTVLAAILARMGEVADLDKPLLREGLARLFPAASMEPAVDWQKLACAVALSRRFAVISGGPGTGKTTTAVKVLALLLEQNPAMKIRLAAPTGKAAARMVESIRSARQRLQLAPDIAEKLPDEASTLHRLLGYRRQQGSWGFRHHAENPLLLDCLLIDEASMIDLPLMGALLSACRAQTRIILLGDRDQLASVEAGNVLGDITGHGQALHYSPDMAALLQELCEVAAGALPVSAETPPVANALALLRTSYRFQQDSGIAVLARAVNAADTGLALAALARASGAGELALNDLVWLQPGTSDWQPLNAEVLRWAVSRYGDYLACPDVVDALSRFAASRILCAAHEGPLGERELNARIAERLRGAGLLSVEEEGHGTPVMVSVNDYEIELFNGDIGLLWRNEEGLLQACFPGPDGEVRRVPAGSLPEHVPAWAMTVHKSQGSEFDEVLLVLPNDSNSPLLLRELLYTGITRARKRLLLHTSAAALEKACQTPVQRSSGLAARLAWSSSGN